MKKSIYTAILSLLIVAGSTAAAQAKKDNYLGLPGDNFNLYATMELFQESETLEDFERRLNDENSMINNLDLNGDGLVDYIMVMDYEDGNVHTIVLRAALDRDETQDVAVFTVERFRNGAVQIQLVGDEALYGRNYIIEPIYAETPNPGYTGPGGNVVVGSVTTYEVAAWPVIQFIYRPAYVSWRSSWYFGYYPNYWNPWRPFYYHTYYGYHQNFYNHYHGHYRHWDHHRYHNYHDVYYSRIRTYSPTVHVRIDKGHYRSTYSRPDLRREGQVLYSRTHENNRRVRSIESVRRSRDIPVQTEQRRESRSVSSGSERRSDAPSISRQPGSERRSEAPAVSRSTNRPAVNQAPSSPRRTTSGTTERAVTTPSTQKKATVSPEPTNQRSPRTYQKPAMEQRKETPRQAPAVNRSREVPSSQARPSSSPSRRPGATITGGQSSKTNQAPARVRTQSPSAQPKATPPTRSSNSKKEQPTTKSSRGKSKESNGGRR
jgi:hypothetical protein